MRPSWVWILSSFATVYPSVLSTSSVSKPLRSASFTTSWPGPADDDDSRRWAAFAMALLFWLPSSSWRKCEMVVMFRLFNKSSEFHTCSFSFLKGVFHVSKTHLFFDKLIVFKIIKNIGPILDDRLKEKFLKPWKGVLCIHFRVCVSVCVSVCLSVRGLQSTPYDLWT